MQEALKVIIEIQELDMKMIRLMRLKKERQKELREIETLRQELYKQFADKEEETKELGRIIEQEEEKIREIGNKIKKLEGQQANIKKADEFNALTLEMTAAEREKHALEQKVSDLLDKKVSEEELLETIRTSLSSSEESGKELKKEVENNIRLINEEGLSLKNERDALTLHADKELLRLYERLLKNKKDRVIVPIENRTCSGCHITLTAQHENLVRKGDGPVFCEHCSRIHYWPHEKESEEEGGKKRKRRRTTTGV